jgi:CBS domain-containing protein
MSLREFCDKNVISISPEANVLEACRLMKDNNVGCVIVQERKKLCGVLTDRDIALKVTGENRDPRQTEVREIMSRSPVSIQVDSDLQRLTNLMRVHHVRRVPIVDGIDEPMGIVTMDDVVARMSSEFYDLGNVIAQKLPVVASKQE